LEKIMEVVNPFAGNWTYRSFRNNPDPVGDDPQKALALIFGEGQLSINDAEFGAIKGIVSFGDQYILDLKGWAGYGTPYTARFEGVGRKGTKAEGWIYDYVGYLIPNWPNGVDQRAAIVGSVIRTVPHNGAAAGYVASFIAVKQD
jgi:hypothetical protein